MISAENKNETLAPICADCMHIVGKRTYLDEAERWRCHHPKNVLVVDRDPVTGNELKHLQFGNCYDTRRFKEGCSAEGRWFEKYEPTPHALQRHQPKAKPSGDDLLASLEDKLA